ncbi:exported protein of unknown function [Acidithiobacillus ferrivorans]|uniref:Type IV pilus biogenesis protein PilM n=1 Tax=Acidithiobacillus ferrivorans TaxID=160808 RepID=A0A7T4WCF6_9PROT|nr:type IV pilus biogenesis protein PilM [Acidithiobacillus ferrivorans]QQD72000.1 type IV pilus biogenesis protein PilM [Acidithiobacillus ferrivorans]SMH64822.1 exported protein of unknown function [Acidithiobacillus ferrivorans]
MIFWILPMLLAVFMVSAQGLARNQADAVLPPVAQVSAAAVGQDFVAYRNAVGVYASANPAFTGSVPASSLALPGGMPLLQGADNQITATASGQGRIITCWATLPASAVFQTIKNMNGDASMGLVSGTQWSSPVYGPMGNLPSGVQVPNGDAVSIVQIGN